MGHPLFEVRRAHPEDVEKIRAFFASLASLMASKRGGEDLLRFTESQIENEHGDLAQLDNSVVGLFEGSVVAYATLQTLERGPHQRAQLNVFYIDASGNTGDLIRTVVLAGEALAKDSGADALDIISLPGDQILKSALEERGYRARLLLMHRSL